jgi:hypothetical protein
MSAISIPCEYDTLSPLVGSLEVIRPLLGNLRFLLVHVNSNIQRSCRPLSHDFTLGLIIGLERYPPTTGPEVSVGAAGRTRPYFPRDWSIDGRVTGGACWKRSYRKAYPRMGSLRSHAKERETASAHNRHPKGVATRPHNHLFQHRSAGDSSVWNPIS